MGAGGSVLKAINGDQQDNPNSNPNPNPTPTPPSSVQMTLQSLGDPIPPSKAPAKERSPLRSPKEREGNTRSKFPGMSISSMSIPGMSISKQGTKEADSITKGPQVFKIEIAVDVPCLSFLKQASSMLLRVSIESLDLIKEGSEALIIQFPYQNISSWGSSPLAFQFSVFNNGNKFELTESKEEEEKEDYVKNVPSLNSDETDTTFRTEFGKSTSKENVSFNNTAESEDVIIVLKTNQASLIERCTMAAVQLLMADIERCAVTKVEFEQLLIDVYDPYLNALKPDWEETILRCSHTRSFLAKQAMDLMVFVNPIAPFEKYDLACLLYKKVLNKGSFQLVVNTFEDPRDRENLIHRLKLDNKDNKEHGIPEQVLVSDCSMIIARAEGCAVVPLIR